MSQDHELMHTKMSEFGIGAIRTVIYSEEDRNGVRAERLYLMNAYNTKSVKKDDRVYELASGSY
jgi:hypothetical protein